MIKFKLIDNRTKVSKQIAELKDKLEIIPKEFLKETVTEIVLESPVDTGTYMDSHNVGVVGAMSSSKGKPRHQNYQDHADKALERMFAQIDALPESTTKHFIANNSEHAWKVEYEFGYAPYTTARAKAQQILDRVIARVMRGSQ